MHVIFCVIMCIFEGVPVCVHVRKKRRWMVRCSSPDCGNGCWFHYDCVGITSSPDDFADWWCSDACRATGSSAFCCCNQVRAGSPRVICANADCIRGTAFHLSCVGLKELPGHYSLHYSLHHITVLGFSIPVTVIILCIQAAREHDKHKIWDYNQILLNYKDDQVRVLSCASGAKSAIFVWSEWWCCLCWSEGDWHCSASCELAMGQQPDLL